MTFALAFVVATATASAAAPSAVRLHLADCVAEPDLVMDLVQIELGGGRLVDTDADLEVYSACEARILRIYITRDRTLGAAPGRVVLDVAERRISLTDVQGDGGARLVALNIAELVQDVPAPPAPPPVEVAAPPPAPARAPGLRLRLGAAPTVRYVPRPDRPVPGARVSLGLDGGPAAALPWTVEVDAGFEQSDSALELGRVRTRVASFAARVGARWPILERLTLFTLVGVRGGWVWLAGASEAADVVTTAGDGPWFGPTGAAALRYGDQLGVAIGVEGGWTASGVFGDAAGTRVGLEAGWLGAEVRLDWRFGG